MVDYDNKIYMVSAIDYHSIDLVLIINEKVLKVNYFENVKVDDFVEAVESGFIGEMHSSHGKAQEIWMVEKGVEAFPKEDVLKIVYFMVF